ncbi:MAG: GtrA family protein [Bacteroidales bacterium]|nr:GtrA family protein [Bacteroidales bacterium]
MFFDLLHRLFIKPSSHWLMQMFRYAWISLFTYLLDAGILFVFTEFVGLHYLVSTVIAAMISGTVNYFLCITPNMFGATSNNKYIEFLIFTLIGVGSLGINLTVMWIFTDFLHLYYMISKVISIVAVFLWTFFMRRYLFLKDEKRK